MQGRGHTDEGCHVHTSSCFSALYPPLGPESPRRCQLAAPPLLLDITTKWKIKPVKKNIFIQKIRKMHVLSIVGILSCNVFIDVQTSILLVYVGLKVDIES